MMARRFLVAATSVALGHMHQNSPGNVAYLPPVESVLTKADGKAGDFAAQAEAMQKMVEQSQRKGREALGVQKADYEKELAEQAVANTAVQKKNDAIRELIAKAKSRNAKLKEETSGIQANNVRMRKALQQIVQKVDTAGLFVADSLKVTDDSGAPELEVLKPTTARPTLNNFLQQTEASFLQIPDADQPSGSANDLVRVLSGSLKDIAEAQKEGAAELKAHFLANFEQERNRQQELLSQQANLNTTLDEQITYQKQLLTAKDHLAATQKSLTYRLHGLRVFARKLDQTAHDVLGGDNVKSAQGIIEGSVISLVGGVAPQVNMSQVGPAITAKPQAAPAATSNTAATTKATATANTKATASAATNATATSTATTMPTRSAAADKEQLAKKEKAHAKAEKKVAHVTTKAVSSQTKSAPPAKEKARSPSAPEGVRVEVVPKEKTASLIENGSTKEVKTTASPKETAAKKSVSTTTTAPAQVVAKSGSARSKDRHSSRIHSWLASWR